MARALLCHSSRRLSFCALNGLNDRENPGEKMEMSELSLKEMTLGERMVLAARLAVARHWFNSVNAAGEQRLHESDESIGGADRNRITEDPRG
jgi:hypothetical protein